MPRFFRSRLESRVVQGVFVTGLVLYFALLLISKPTYQAVMVLGPTPGNTRSPLANALPANALSLLGMSSLSSSNVNDFEVFRQLLSSEEVAQILFNQPGFKERVLYDQWDSELHRWRPDGLLVRLQLGFNALLGVKDLRTDRSRVAVYVEKVVDEYAMERTGFDRITAVHKDPDAAVFLLSSLYKADDNYLRQLRVNRIRSYLDFLNARVQVASNEAHRTALIDLIISQERELMLAQSGQPYAAEMVRSPAIERTPVKPKPLQWLGVMLIIAGAVSGMILYLMRKEGGVAPIRQTQPLPPE